MIGVEVWNFQSIEKLSIEIDGFTALVGRSNIGKSALVRAIKAALTNELGVQFVRHEVDCARLRRGLKTCKCQTTVHIVMDGFDLLWEKGDAVNKYTFNGKVYDSPGQGIPDFLAEDGFAQVKIGDKLGTIQVADQFFPIFLLNQSGSAVADAISDVARLDRINKAIRLVDKDKRENTATRKVRDKDVSVLQGKLGAYDGLDVSLRKVEKAVAGLEGVMGAHEKVTNLTGYVDRSQDLVTKIKVIWEVGKVPIPDTKPVLGLWSKVQALDLARIRLGRVVAEYKPLLWVDTFEVPEVAPITTSFKSVQRLNGWVSRLESFRQAFVKIEQTEKVEVPAIVSVVKAHKKIETLTGYAAKLARLNKAIEKIEADFKRVEGEESTVLAELQALGVCPTCTLPITGRHVHA